MTNRNVLILKFPYSSLFGGGEQHTLNLVEGLRKRGFSFFLISSCSVLLREFQNRNWPCKKIWAPKEPVAKGSVILFPFLAPYFLVRLFLLLIIYIANYRIKILYCFSLTEKILITLPARILGIKVVWIEHVTVERWLTLNPFKIFYRFYSHFAKIVAISEAIRKQLIEEIKINPKRILVIYNGVNLPPANFHDFKSRVNKKGFIVGVIARLEREKGIEYLLRAIEIVKEIIPQIKLIVVGEGSQKKNLQWLARSININNLVQFVGFQENIKGWIRNFDALVLPSAKRESFGIVLIETMANLRPVIASRIGGITEIIEDKKTGLLVEPANSEELAQAIIYLYNHPQEVLQIIKQARVKVESSFTKEQMINAFEKLFITLLR
ncbi:MAG: hypothetical protein COT24_04970 [Candidatus Kerfeldbacteria bacterium CG08_land_8_20_14_0_20_40_16]|uniref:Glycosyltransferase family 1 protein n=1 Tax=Candidatus Kerfeldbacteria bacterium CG08_land_8_20_14_0_20_40_16 TaxID=2014244 RepID=A0A2H0YUK4_9BACT|nr:MAG: hypothetical protein COT24_04970 [Candidatus Kerfeldbacteria bacterium CG08_land_8_20_14_0_20_40_16]